MKSSHRLLATAVLLLAAGSTCAEIFRCTSRDGAVTYQQEPCAAAAVGGAVGIATSYP
ncbi:MAG: DUF4124 domain-containing protein, partial [Usitatibacter sp.]